MNMTGTLLNYYSKRDEEYIHPPRGGLSSCPGCAMALALRLFSRGIGENVVFVSTMGCGMVVAVGPELITKKRDGEYIPWIFSPFGSTASCGAGLKAALVARGETETEVVVWAGDGAAFDIGYGGLSAAAERNEDILYVCYDNESYQNTGNQRSSATPWGAITTTNPAPAPKPERKKAMTLLMADHRIAYGATSTVAYPEDFMNKVRKAKDMKGFRFLHILTPCPTGWLYPSELTIKLSRLAVETKIFPLFEVEDGTTFTMNKEPEGIPVEEYIKIQGRFKLLTPDQIVGIQKEVDKDWKRLKWLAAYE